MGFIADRILQRKKISKFENIAIETAQRKTEERVFKKMKAA